MGKEDLNFLVLAQTPPSFDTMKLPYLWIVISIDAKGIKNPLAYFYNELHANAFKQWLDENHQS